MRGAVQMRKKLVRHGNSKALVLDRTLLELLEVGEDDDLDVDFDGGELRIRAARPASERDKRFAAALERTMRENDALFRRLAE